MPVAMPLLAATASASSTTSSRVVMRPSSASIPTLHRTGTPNAPLILRLLRSQGWQQRSQFFQAAQIVAGQDQVDVRGGHHHAQRAARATSMWVQPDDAVAEPG